MTGWLSLLLCYAGFAALACAMPRHFAQITGRRGAPLRPRLWQGAGALLLALSFVATALSLGSAAWARDGAIYFLLLIVVAGGTAAARVARSCPNFVVFRWEKRKLAPARTCVSALTPSMEPFHWVLFLVSS